MDHLVQKAGCSVALFDSILFYRARVSFVLCCFQVQMQELIKARVYVYQDANDAARGRVLFHDFVWFLHPWHSRRTEESSRRRLFFRGQRITLTLTFTLTLTRPLTLILSLFHSHSHTHIHTLSPTLTLTHTHTLMDMRTDLTAVPHAGLGYHFLRVQVRTPGSWRSSREKRAKLASRKRNDRVTT